MFIQKRESRNWNASFWFRLWRQWGMRRKTKSASAWLAKTLINAKKRTKQFSSSQCALSQQKCSESREHVLSMLRPGPDINEACHIRQGKKEKNCHILFGDESATLKKQKKLLELLSFLYFPKDVSTNFLYISPRCWPQKRMAECTT